jgi:uncharacterized membrane protein
MQTSANAMSEIRNGFLRSILVAATLLIAASVATAQSISLRPDSIRDRLFPPQIGSQSGQPDGVSFPGTIDGKKRSRIQISDQLATPSRGLTIPYWSDSFSYRGITYKYDMVGTDPKRGSATTTIQTVIIPMRFVFENGLVFDAATDLIDGQTSIQGMINSPIFQNYDFTSGGTHVGNTQYGDAFQRANFWNSVSRRSPDYHVLLGQPSVAPAFEVFVPNSMVRFVPEGNGEVLPQIDEDFLQQATLDALAQTNVSTQALSIVDWGNVLGTFTSGYHRNRLATDGVQTYIATGYHPRTPFFRFQDTAVFSHEVLEWLDDPFEFDNFTPGWDPVFSAYPRCISEITDDELEVGDVFEFTPQGFVALNTANGLYHLQEGAFLDYFTRNATSRSVNGQYSFFGVASSPSASCIGHLEIQPTLIEFSNATVTVADGINDRGQIVGVFIDQSNIVHGFIYDRGQYTQLDHPGAIETDLNGINNSGQIAGYYLDVAGLPHGFVYFHGTFSPVDFPGATDSAPLGINSRGDIVGAYDLTSAITHGFAFQNGQFITVDSPFGPQTEVSSINDFGHVAGIAFDDPSGPIHGFILGRSGFTNFDLPGALITVPNAINDQGEHGGVFFEPDIFIGTLDGFGYVTINGNTYALNYYLLGMNNQNQIVGNAFNFITNRRIGFVATIPSGNNSSDDN